MSTESPVTICMVVGLSGAGKSTALRVFEDLGYFAIGGLPGELTSDVAAMLQKDAMRRYPGVAIAPDMRQPGFTENFKKMLAQLHGLVPKVIFLEADTETLIRRYATTRRPHPLEISGCGIESAIRNERAMLEPLRRYADLIIDSTDYSIHDLRRTIQRQFARCGCQKLLRVNMISFGFKYGIPQDADFVFDLRFLDNPYFVEGLASLSGLDAPVRDFVFAQPAANEYKRKILDLLHFSLPQMENEGRYRVTVALGCTGGRHRSVAMSEEIGLALKQSGYPLIMEHRCLHNDVSG